MGITNRISSTYRSYSSLYWVVISLELFERGAYYGIMGYFPVHLMENLGFSGTEFGILYALLVFLLYFVPIIASSLAKKVGYKTILTIAFVIIIPSYLIMTFTKSWIAFLPIVIAWGIGAGAFKPMVSATIAHVTEKKHRNSAYSIYYLSINWGSLIAMVLIGIFIPQAFAHLVFLVGAVLITINLLITIFLYRDPVEKDPTEKVGTSFTNMIRVLSDGKFALLLLIYSGFFLIFSSMHTFLPAYYTGFGLKPFARFEAPIMSAFNPLTIVILGPFLSRFTDRFESLKLMIIGMLIFCSGLLILGMMPAWYTMMIGIVIFSIGEFLTHPNFISYVSKIAPEDKVALYMGYAFLPSAVGQVVGSVFGGVLWDKVAVGMGRPSLFWGIYIVIGIFTMGNFLLYNMKFGPRPKVASIRGIWRMKRTVAGVWSFAPIVFITGMMMPGLSYIAMEGDGTDGPAVLNLESMVVVPVETIQASGYLGENSEVIEEVNITPPENHFLRRITATVTWRDESDIRRIIRTYENEGDEFGIEFFLPGDERTGQEPISRSSDMVANQHGSPGEVTLELGLDHEFETSRNGTGIWQITVICGTCGDYYANFPSLTYYQDDGNEYSLSLEYDYYTFEGSDQ